MSLRWKHRKREMVEQEKRRDETAKWYNSVIGHLQQYQRDILAGLDPLEAAVKRSKEKNTGDGIKGFSADCVIIDEIPLDKSDGA